MELDFSAIIKPVFFLVLYTVIGFISCKLFVKEEHNKFLKKITFNVLLPCLIFSSMISGLTVEKVISNIGLILFQLFFSLLGYFVYRLFYKKKIENSEDRVKLGVIIFANAGYIPIALFSGMFSGDLKVELLNLVFLLLIGFNIIVFSYGELLFSKTGIKWSKLANAPLISIFFSCLFVLLGWNNYVPDSIIRSTAFFGHFTIPFVMFSLGGGIFFSYKEKIVIEKIDILKMFIVKGLVFPLIGLSASFFIKNELVAFLVFVEFLVPPASNLVVLSRNDYRQSCVVSTYIYYTYLFSVLYLPFWLFVYLWIK